MREGLKVGGGLLNDGGGKGRRKGAGWGIKVGGV